MQQHWYLTSIDQNICPQEAFQNNLTAFIASCQRRNEQIILCISLNKDINRINGPLNQNLLHNNNLVNVMMNQHKMPAPLTHNHGSTTIDAIYALLELAKVENTGWLKSDQGIGNHRIAYINTEVNKLGKDRYEIAR